MWFEFIAYGAAIVLMMPAAIVCAECLAAMLPGRRGKKNTAEGGCATRVAVIVPAHNEEEGLGATLSQIKGQLKDGDRLIVVADNCTDATSAMARQWGAEVVERHEDTRRGKGFAVDAGLRYLQDRPPDFVVMVDADCYLENGSIEALVEQVRRTSRPAQAVYLMRAPAGDVGPRGAVSVLAFLVKNWVRPLGLKRLGMPCLLTGTGMAFAWEDTRRVSVASDNIVEDMQMGLDLAMKGKGPMLCEAARVMGTLPSGTTARATQRRRWEHGHLRTMLTQVPRLIGAAFSNRDARLAVLAMEVGVPPLSLLVMGMAAGAAAGVALGMWRGVWGPSLLLAGALAALAASVALAWGRFGRGRVPGKALVAAPVYAASKMMMYASFVLKPQKKWVRTPRVGEEGSNGEVVGVESVKKV